MDPGPAHGMGKAWQSIESPFTIAIGYLNNVYIHLIICIYAIDISLQEELETVDLYMNIENTRFKDEIDFRIDVAPGLNPASIKIPSLVLQPFLENALWHGLSSKKGKKKIRMEVIPMGDDYIEISIQDNGIGREASEKLNLQKTLKRKSLGIPITRERLAYFSRVYQNSFDLRFRDIVSPEGKVEGTEVLLRIPTV